MTQEDKELLLKDLCARLPYGVICKSKCIEYDDIDGDDTEWDVEGKLDVVGYDYVIINSYQCELDETKPYLRPMSSITEEEKKEFESLGWRVDELDGNVPWNHNAYNVFEGVDWLNFHHFDFRGLIGKNLALEAPETMYKRFGDMTVVVYKGTKY